MPDTTPDTRTLRRGERQRIWAKPGPDDPANGYEMRFVGFTGAGEWGATISGTHPDGGGPGVYRWASNDAPGPGPTGTAVLTPGSYRVQLRHITGDLVDIEELPDNLLVE